MGSGCGGDCEEQRRSLNDGPVVSVPLLRLPHVVEQFDHLLVDDEDDGHI